MLVGSKDGVASFTAYLSGFLHTVSYVECEAIAGDVVYRSAIRASDGFGFDAAAEDSGCKDDEADSSFHNNSFGGGMSSGLLH